MRSLWFFLMFLLAAFAVAGPVEPGRVADAFRALDERYDSPTLRIWLDRPGDDLRGHFEGRINPPWWSAANAAEAMVDFMNATGRPDFDARLTEMHRIWGDPMSRWPLVAEELKKRGQWRGGERTPERTGIPRGSAWTWVEQRV